MNLFHDLEGYTVVQLAELLSLGTIGQFLIGKIPGRESDDDQSLVLIFLIQFLQSFKLWSETTLAGCIDYHQNFSFKLGKIYFLAFTR